VLRNALNTSPVTVVADGGTAASQTEKLRYKKKSVGPVKPKRHSKENTYCRSCGYQFGAADDPFIEDAWLKCTRCENWSHEPCRKSTKIKFICNMCLEL